MTTLSPIAPTLAERFRREAIPFDPASPDSLAAAVAALVASLGEGVEALGLGEPLHGGAEILALRNRIFRCLVEAHGYSAIAVESSYPRSRLVNDYVAGRGAMTWEDVQDEGFSYGFRRLEGNRELVEWMRAHNADPAHGAPLRFYGFDSPTEMVGTDSPRQLLGVALDYLAGVDEALGQAHRERIAPLLGRDDAWRNPAAMLDPAQAVGRSPEATQLRIETEELIATLKRKRPELVALSDRARYLEAEHCAASARGLLNYHTALATPSADRTARLLGLRDAMMADNVEYILACERGRGKVLLYAHNSHLQRGAARWQLGPELLTWQPVGAHLAERLSAEYAVIGCAVGASEAQGIGQPEAGSLEALLIAAPGPARFVPTHRGQGLPTEEVAALATRSGSAANSTYFPLTPQSLADFDWLLALDSSA